MKKFTGKIPQEAWGNINTKFAVSSKRVGVDEFTSGSKNFDTDANGSITKRKGGTNYNSSTFAGTPDDQYEHIFSDGTRHLLVAADGTIRYTSGDGSFNSIVNGTGFSATSNLEFASYLDLVYGGNGINNPIVYDKTVSYGGVVYSVPRIKDMGAQVPSSALTSADGGAGTLAAGTYTYQVTFLYYGYEESNAGPSSTPLVLAASKQASLTAIPIGGYGVTARKIYREISTSPGLFRLVGTISNNTATTFTDNTATGTSLIPTDNNVPSSFKYIVSNLDRLWTAGHQGFPFTLRFSAAGLPDIYPIDNEIYCNQQDFITGLAVFNGKVVVLNRNSFGQILGTSTDTFRYDQIPGNIGCVDNRTIQTRVINGVPVLIWLSDKGFYAFDGSNLNHISESIENYITEEIQQATIVKGSNSQGSQADFLGGTASPSIDLVSDPGIITQPNPKKSWPDQSNFEEAGYVGNSIATKQTNLSAVTNLAPAYTTGTHTGTQESSGSLVLPVTADYTGENNQSPFETLIDIDDSKAVAYKISVPRSGTITSLRFHYLLSSSAQVNYTVRTDNSGNPSFGAFPYFSGSTGVRPAGANDATLSSLAISLTAGVTYWICLESSVNITQVYATNVLSTDSSYTRRSNDGFFTSSTVPRLGFPGNFLRRFGAFTFNITPVSSTGQWYSANYDTKSDSATPASITHTGTFPVTFGATTSSTTYIEGSNDGLTFDVSQLYSSLNGTSAVSLSVRRYWRIRIQLNSSDNRVSPTIGASNLKFPTSATWTSAAIDHTIDITALNSLTATTVVPSGTSVTLEVATSANNITYSAYSSIGSATPQRYTKVRVTITTNAANDTTATVDDVLLTWTIVGNLVSSIINTGLASGPAGWDIVQFIEDGNVVIEMKSASTIGGLTGATYYVVTNGAFPSSVPLNQYVQWRATLTSIANTIPTVDSVTINWLVNSTLSIKAASIFYDKGYYVALSEYGNLVNNVVLYFDSDGKWRIYKGLNISTLSFFFNDPYYGNANEGRIIRFLSSTATTDPGSVNIEMDVRTKAFDLDEQTKKKILTKVFVTGIGTGATYTASYSTDGGTTFKSLVNSSGTATFTTNNDNMIFTERLVPQSSDDYNGQTILFRLYNNDSFACDIQEITFSAWIREGDIL